MSDSEEEFYNTEPIRIEGPGLGQNRKSFSKFVDLDLARLVHTGLDVDRPGDESYVNAFDIKNQMRLALSEQVAKAKRETLGEIFILLMQEHKFDYKDLVNPQSTIKYNAHLPGIQSTVCSLLGVKELKKLNILASPAKSSKSSSTAGKKQQVEAESTHKRHCTEDGANKKAGSDHQSTPKKLRITMTSVHQPFVRPAAGLEDTVKSPRAPSKDRLLLERAKTKDGAVASAKNKNANQKEQWQKQIVSVTTTAPQVPLDFDQQLLKIQKQQELSQEFPRRQQRGEADHNFIEPFRNEPEVIRLSQGVVPKEAALFSSSQLRKKDISGRSEQGFGSSGSRRGSAGQTHAGKGSKNKGASKKSVTATVTKQFTTQPSKVFSIMTSSQAATNAASEGLTRKLKQQIAEKMKEMRKYLREQEFFENIKDEDIQKNLDFLLENVKSDDKFDQGLATFNKNDEEDLDDLMKIQKAVYKMNQTMLDASPASSVDLVNPFHQSPQRSAMNSQYDVSEKKLNPSTSECQIEVRALRDGYRDLVTKLNEMSQDNLSYFHQEFKTIRQQTKPQTQRPAPTQSSEGLEESQTVPRGGTRSPGMTAAALSHVEDGKSLALVEELPVCAHETPSKSASSEDSYNPNVPFKNKNLNRKLNQRLVAKLQPPPLSPTILCRDQSESMQQAHLDAQLNADHTGQELQDYVCLKQEQDQKAAHTRSETKMTAALYEELHGEISSAEKKKLLARGVILPAEVTVEETNSLGHATSMSDGMGSLTNSSASQVDPYEQAQLEKTLAAAQPKNYMKPTFKHLKLFEHNKLRKLKNQITQKNGIQNSTTIKVQNQADSHLETGDYGKVIPPSKLYMTVSNRRSSIPAISTRQQRTERQRTEGSAESLEGAGEFTNLKSKYLTTSTFSRSIVQRTENARRAGGGYNLSKLNKTQTVIQHDLRTARKLGAPASPALQLKKFRDQSKYETPTSQLLQQRGQSPELRALFTRLGRPTPLREHPGSGYTASNSFNPSKSVFRDSESRGATLDTLSSMMPDLQQKPAVFTAYDPVAFYVNQAKQQRPLIHKRISEEAYAQASTKPSHLHHYAPSDGGPKLNQTLRSHKASVARERNTGYFHTTSNFPTFDKGTHRFSCVSPPGGKPIAPVASPLTPAEGKAQRHGRTAAVHSSAVASADTKPTWSSQYQRPQHQSPNLYQGSMDQS